MDQYNNDGSGIFSTRDIYLATTLVTMQIELLGIDMEIEGIKAKPVGYFKFKDTDELREIRKQYSQAKILVEPKMYVTNLQSLKSEVVNLDRSHSLTSQR